MSVSKVKVKKDKKLNKNKYFGEIYLAYVKFTDNTGIKQRPVVVIEEKRDIIEVFELTSRTNKFDNEFELVDWVQTGLKKSSTVKAGSLLKLSKKHFIRKIGDLSYRDIKSINYYLNKLEHEKNKCLEKHGFCELHKSYETRKAKITNKKEKDAPIKDNVMLLLTYILIILLIFLFVYLLFYLHC